MEKLNFDHWPESQQLFIRALIDVLTALDPATLAKHVDLARTAPDGLGDLEHLEMPSFFSLPAYGAAGLAALKELTKDDFAWSAPQALLAVAVDRPDVLRGFTALTKRYLSEAAFRQLQARLEATCKDANLRALAREYLAEVVQWAMSEPKERDRLGRLLEHTTLPFRSSSAPDPDAAMNFVLELIAQSSLTVSGSLCDELEKLIDQDLPEQKYQEFLERHPALVDPLASAIVPRQYLGEEWRSDFVIRRLDDEYVFVEIEKPRDTPATSYPQPSGPLAHALGQVLNWFTWIEDNIAYAQSHGFPGIHAPRAVIVVGRARDLSSRQARMLKQLNDALRPRIRVHTYDEIVLNGRNIVRNMSRKMASQA